MLNISVIRILKKFRIILSNHQKKRIVQLAILMLIGGALETCSVGLILPFIDAVVNIDTIMNKWYVQKVCAILGLQYPFTFLFVVAVSLGLLYILKNLFLLFEYNVQYRFVYGNQAMMQSRMLSDMINRPYEFFLRFGSGEAVRIINNDLPDVFQLLLQLLSLFTELIVSVMLIAAIFVIVPLVTLIIAGILLVMLFLINMFIKPKLSREGSRTQLLLSRMNKWLLQSIQGIKEVKVMGMEEYFCGKFSDESVEYANCRRRHGVYVYVPRFIIEAVCMASLFFVIAVLIITGSRFDDIMPMLSAVAMASIRLLPSVNRISVALSNIAYYEPMIDVVIDNLVLLEDMRSVQDDKGWDDRDGGNSKNQDDIPKESGMAEYVEFKKITYHYPGRDTNVLENASMIIHKGEAIGIVGDSGAGKTTVVDIILGLMNPQEGQVLLDGVDIREDIRAWHECIGYIPQMIFMLDATVRDNIVFGREAGCEVSDEAVWKALDEAALGDFVRNLPEGLDTEIGERGIRLSGGQRQRIGIARALYGNPEVLIFDEATSALDNNTEAEIMHSIYELQGKRTLIIIAHRLTTIERCDHVYRVEDGKILKER